MFGSGTFGGGTLGGGPVFAPPAAPRTPNPITFTRVPTIAVDAVPTHTQAVNMARAANDRILSGVGNIAWRVVYMLEGLWRQVRNPDSSGFAFAPQLEATNGLLAVNPDKSEQTWPVADPGDYEGANLANPMMAQVFGVNEIGSESDSLGPPYFSIDAPTTPTGFWQLGKEQRGAYDPATGVQAWPAGEAAQRFFQIAHGYWEPHGKAWGGFQPSPVELLSDCGTTEETGAGIPSREIKFTSLDDGTPAPAGHHGTVTTVGGKTVVTYAGSCPCGTDSTAAGHVQGTWVGSMATYVWVMVNPSTCESSLDRFPLADWIEGPYTGVGNLHHTDGGQLRRVMHAAASDYRGTPGQRTPDTFKIQDIAFDHERFLSTQYALTPANGTQSGEYVTPDYLQGVLTGATTIAAGTVAQIHSADTYAGASGFVVAGFCAWASGLTNSPQVEILDGTTVLATLTLTKDGSGNAEAMKWLTTALRPTALKYRLATAATFTSSAGSITIEAAEIVEGKPEYYDAAMLLKLFSASHAGQVPGRGVDFEESKAASDSIFQYGCAVGQQPDSDVVAVNQNSTFDVARRLTNSMLRTLGRLQFVAYEVAGGKSILYLKRFAVGIPDAVTDRVDLLDGIAPPYDPIASGELVEGETYLVHGTTGSVTYDGDTVALNGTFTATAVLTYTATGDAAVYVQDGIRAHALANGWSNRWCGFAETKRYRNSEDSIWKPSSYTDYWPFCDRCHFASGSAPAALRRMMTISNDVVYDGADFPKVHINARIQASMFAPEGPDGYRYSTGANTMGDGANHPTEFRKSCRVYEPVLEITSATVHDWSGNQVIKLVFSDRFHSHESAPATWSATAPTWLDGGTVPAAVTDLIAEDYRTMDNALRSYHVHMANSFWNADVKVGDHGMNTSVSADPELNPGFPWGSIYPQFFLVALVNTPYEDGNATVEPTDTRMTVDELQKVELYLRAGCEGFVDDRTSAEIICATGYGDLFDYSFENLCFDAFEGRWIGSVGEALRADNPDGFGPLPNTRLYVDIYNRLAAAWNLLDRARVSVPMQLERKTTGYTGTGAIGSVDWGTVCDDFLKFSYTGPAASTIVSADTEWTPVDPGDSVSSNVFSAPDGSCSGDQSVVVTTKTINEYRIVPTSEWLDTLPLGLQDLIEGGSFGVMCELHDVSAWTEVENIGGDPPPTDGTTCPGASFGPYRVNNAATPDVPTCVMATSGTLDCGSPFAGVYGYYDGCGGFGTNRYLELVPFADQVGFIKVPLVDPV